jgi:hypothetical protein
LGTLFKSKVMLVDSSSEVAFFIGADRMMFD